MNEQDPTPKYGSPDGQHPHVPGHDPLGSGMPRQRDTVAAAPAEDEPASPPPDDDGAPLGGDETTEDQLSADTAVEQDALKSLDPDDPPA